MTLTFDNQTLLLVGVGAQLLGSLAKTLFRKPQQQAQIDRIEGKISDTLAQVSPVLSTLAALKTPAAPQNGFSAPAAPQNGFSAPAAPQNGFSAPAAAPTIPPPSWASNPNALTASPDPTKGPAQ